MPAREDTILIEFDIDDSPLIALEKQIKEMYDQMTGGQINEFEDNLSDIVGVAKDASEGVEDLNESFRELDELIEGLSGDFDNMSKDVAGLGEDVDKVSKGVKGVGKSGKGLSPFIEGLRGIAGNADLAQKATEQLAKDAKRLQAVGAGLKSFFGAVGKAALVGMAAAGAAAGAVAIKLGKAVTSAYADYEQLIGGVDTLFDEASQTVQNFAANAFKTAGLSANEYMETVTSFSASLIQSLGGDTEKAAQVADMAITDMADNANKMGSEMSSIQDAYQGFAKQNYTMLDNLKLGYGGTKTEMERLLADAKKISGIEYDISSYADVVEAIHVIQTEMGITGTTALEAADTISGSIASMGSSIKNLMAGLGNADADVGMLIDNVVDAFRNVVKNIVPVLKNIVAALPKALGAILPAISSLLPSLLKTVTGLFVQVLETILKLLPELIPAAQDAVMTIVGALIDNLPLIINAGVQMLSSLVEGIDSGHSQLIPAAVKLAINLATGFLQSIPKFLKVGAKFIYGVLDGLIAELPNVLTSLAGIPQQMGDTLSSNLSGALQGILQILNDLGNTFLGVAQAALPPFIGLISFAAGLIANHTGIIKALVVGLLIYKAAQIGVNIAMQAGMVVAALSKAWAVASAVIMMFQSGASFATVAQWALNAAMAANPVGLVVIGVMALIGVILLVVKYWDDLKEAFSTGLDFIANMFDRLALGLANIMPEWLYKLLGGNKQEAVLAIETKMDDRAEKAAARREELEAKKAAKKAEKASKESDPFSMFGTPDNTGMPQGYEMPQGYGMPSSYSMGMPQPDAAAFQPSASSMDSLNYMKADAGATDVWDSYFNAGAQIGPAYAAGMESSMHMPVDAAGGMIEQVDAAVLQPTSSSMDSLNYLQTGVETTTSAISADTLAMSTDYSSQMTAMQTATETGMTAINTTVSAGLASIKSSINAVDLQSDGANLVQGLINGMNSKLGAVKAAASAIANAAKTSVQGALDMHSPSRIMETLGGFTTEGFASGILNGMQTAMASMRTVAQGVLGVMSGTPGALQPAYAGGYTPENTTGAGKSISNINNSTQSTTTTNAPSFTLNMSNSSGSTATDVREMVFAALDEYFGAQDRTANRRKD